MALQIDELQVTIQAQSKAASTAIDSLATSLGNLKNIVKGGAGLTTTTNQLKKFSDTINAMSSPALKISALVGALKPLETIGKSNLGSALNQLKKIPQITEGLDDAKLSAFATKINQVTAAVKPLAVEMEKVSMGFSRLPNNIQKAINANERLTKSNKSTAFSFNMMAAKIGIIVMAVRRVGRVIAGWITESNAYVENLNLFTVAMGEYAKSAQEYAEKVGELMGIDPSAWMRNQGVFMILETGFGVAADKAALMSQNLTQLGYDLSSFFNISVADAMQKLQSGMSGELEPLRRLGFDLSQAKLQSIALANGIDKAFTQMTQAEKSLLRYSAIMTQVTEAQGDMARTLEAPANQIRIFQAQLEQASRALGNIFIPMLNKVLPYAIAFLRTIRWIAQELANLFGFTLPEIDYSNVNTGQIADDLDNANESAKELKKTIFGFDQLNIMNGADSTSSASPVGGGDLDINLPTYDFIQGLTESNASRIFAKWKEDITPTIEYIKDNFETIKSVALVIGGMLLAWKVGSGLVNFVTGLSSLAKSAIGLTIAISGVIIGAGAISDLVSGNGGIGAVIKTALGAALGVVGSLIAFGTGPLGWTIGIGAVLTMTIIGIKMGVDKNIDAIIEQSMGQGNTTISKLSEAFSKMMDGIAQGYQPIIENGAKLVGAKKDVEDATKAMRDAFDMIDSGAISAEESIDKISDLFNSLIDTTELLRTQAYRNITYALSTSLKDTAKSMGVDVAEIMFQLDSLNAGSSSRLKEYRDRQQKLKRELDKGVISVDQYSEGLKTLSETLKVSVSSTDAVDASFRNLQINLEGINWEDEAKRAEALELIGASAGKAQEAASTAFGKIQADVEELRKFATTTGEQMALDEMLRLAKTDTDQANQRISQNLQTVYDMLQIDLLKKLGTVANDAQQKWRGMSPTEAILNGNNEAQFVAKALDKYRKDYIQPITNGLDKEFGTMGVKGQNWLKDVMVDITGKGFTWDFNQFGPKVTGYSNNLTEIINKAIKTAQNNINRSPITIPAKINITNPNVKALVNGQWVPSGSVRAEAYAEGGFPVPGELFLAREAGAEMVGNIGGRTAVANNDQIVEAVAKGVSDAMRGVMSGDKGDINIYIDGLLERSLSAMERKNTRAGRIVVPVGV